MWLVKVFSKFPRLSLTLAHLVSDFLALHMHPLPSWGNWEQRSSCHITSSLIAKHTLFHVFVGLMHVPRVYSNPELLDFNLVFPLPLNSSLCYCRSLSCMPESCMPKNIAFISQCRCKWHILQMSSFLPGAMENKDWGQGEGSAAKSTSPQSLTTWVQFLEPSQKNQMQEWVHKCNPAPYVNVKGKDGRLERKLSPTSLKYVTW